VTIRHDGLSVLQAKMWNDSAIWINTIEHLTMHIFDKDNKHLAAVHFPNGPRMSPHTSHTYFGPCSSGRLATAVFEAAAFITIVFEG
jgi:hypothetical protein